jgi:hypothetical protein
MQCPRDEICTVFYAVYMLHTMPWTSEILTQDGRGSPCKLRSFMTRTETPRPPTSTLFQPAGSRVTHVFVNPPPIAPRHSPEVDL